MANWIVTQEIMDDGDSFMANNLDIDDLQDDSWDDLPPETLDALEQQAVEATQLRDASALQGEPTQTFRTLPTLPIKAVHLAGKDSRQWQPTARTTPFYPQQRTAQHDAAKVGQDFVTTTNFSTTGEALTGTIAVPETQLRGWQHHAFAADKGLAGAAGSDAQLRQGLPTLAAPVRQAVPEQAHASSSRGRVIAIADSAPHASAREENAAATLTAKLQKALRERKELQERLAEAENETRTKVGEIKIVRAQQALQQKESDRKVIAIENRTEEEISRLKAEVSSLALEKNSLKTEIMFSKEDVREERQQPRALRRNMRAPETTLPAPARNNVTAGVVTTPKKSKGPSYRDGFEDDEILMVSPARGSGRSRLGTPKAGGKRKRKGLDDSPIPALQLSQSAAPAAVHEPSQHTVATAHEQVLQKFGARDGRYEFFQLILSHRSNYGRPRTLEHLMRHFFPLKPSVSMTSMILDDVMLLSADQSEDVFIVETCHILLNLWSRCLDEKYYPPIKLLMDLLTCALAEDTMSRAPPLIKHLVSTAQLTAEINVIPRHQRAGASTETDDIDVTECVRLLDLVAMGCVHDREAIREFWRFMRLDFVYVMLNLRQQRREDIVAMLQLLGTSVLDDSFGPIRSEDAVTAIDDLKILDRISPMLVPPPVGVDGRARCSRPETARLRIEALELLANIARSTYGGELLTRHKKIIGRLVRVMNDELDALYFFRSDRKLCAKQVNLATRILYTLVTEHLAAADDGTLQDRLAAVPGGTHKHRVALTRLAFSQGLVMEAEIDDDVVEYARRMLDRVITPEEGEALAAAFGF